MIKNTIRDGKPVIVKIPEFNPIDATVTRRTRSGDIPGPRQRVDVMTDLKAMTL